MGKDMLRTILRNQIVQYLLENGIDRGTPGCYSEVAAIFNVNPEWVRRIYRTLREDGLVTDDPVETKSGHKSTERQFRENVETGKADVTLITKNRIKTLSDLLAVCEVDEKEWQVVSWECNKWEVGRKDKSLDWKVRKGQVKKGRAVDSGKIFVEPLFQVKAKLARRKIETDLQLQKEAILNEMKAYSPKVGARLVPAVVDTARVNLLEICIFDPHFGKLAWRAETDEDYDLKIAETRVKKAVKELLSRVNLATVSKILLPIGNDLINIDNRHNTTFAGTPQDSDCRYMKIIKVVRRILIEIIDELSAIAPVDVIIVPGNHDTTSSFMIGEILDAWYHNNSEVNVDNEPKLRKYYQYGSVGIQLTHGNEEKHDSLGLIFATEKPHLWAATKFRFAQLGHFHKNKKINFTSVDEHQGFQIQVLPSLSGTDFWHKSKGYSSLKQAKSMLFDPNQGLIGEFTSTVI
jgi:hypothetical protein